MQTVRLAAIVFTDMVGYSALCQKSETLAAELLEEHRRMVRDALARIGGREVDTTGDGFLLEFASAQQAMQFAVLVQQRQAARNARTAEERRFQFRVGIHLGEIETRERNIIGDGVNIAARLEPLSPHGGIALSGAVHALVRNRILAGYRSIGTPALKNISVPIEVFVLDAKAVAGTTLPAAEPRIARVTRRWRTGALIAAGIAGAVAALLFARHHPVGPRVADKSVAVLPFSNFSSDKENEYFADGVHDSLLTLLARVKDLKVISRTSVMQYKEGVRNLRDIGRALGVANIVEGSVQRSGNRVRVQAQLIEAATDRHLWAETYDRDLADVFAIQSDVAQQIVAGVQATLTPQEKGRIERKPTSNAAAWDLFTRAEQLRQQAQPTREALSTAQDLLQRAIALDPEFAMAHAMLAIAHIEAYWWGADTTDRRRSLAKAEADIAMRLQPDLTESHLAMGLYHYHGFRDYAAAQKEFDEALARSPNSADLVSSVGYLQRRRGQWDDAVRSLVRSTTLDPRNVSRWTDLAETYLALHRYDESIAAYEHALTIAPEDVILRMQPAAVRFSKTGDLGPLKRTLDAVPVGVDPGQAISAVRVMVAAFEGRYADLIALLEAFPRDTFSTGLLNMEVPKEYFIGFAWELLGDRARAQPLLERAAARLRGYLEREPGSISAAATHAWLGLAQAHLGQKSEALASAREASRLLPIERDALDGPHLAYLVAAIHEQVGDLDGALAQLSTLMKMPAGPHVQDLRHDPEWQKLRDDPRFRKLLDEHRPA